VVTADLAAAVAYRLALATSQLSCWREEAQGPAGGDRGEDLLRRNKLLGRATRLWDRPYGNSDEAHDSGEMGGSVRKYRGLTRSCGPGRTTMLTLRGGGDRTPDPRHKILPLEGCARARGASLSSRSA